MATKESMATAPLMVLLYDSVFVVDAKLAASVQTLGPVTVQASTPKPVRGSGRGPFGTEAGAAEKTVDGVSSTINSATSPPRRARCPASA